MFIGRTRLMILLLTGLTAAACDAPDPTATLEPGPLAVVSAEPRSEVPGVTEVTGRAGPGSTYALFRPEPWNGELVVYAHGYVQPHEPIQLEPEPQFPPIRDYLLSQGFAVAYASGSENGYAVKDGALRTHQLSGLFAGSFGQPTRTYLMGLSLGGLVVDYLSERFSSQYDGTLALCGVMAGGLWNATYVADFRVLFDYFYPGVLPGTLFDMPDGYIVAAGSPGFNAILGAIATNPFPALEMAGMDQIQLQLPDGDMNQVLNELISSFIQVLGYQVNGANALAERLNGKSFFDNTGTTYTGSGDDEALNAAVARYAGDPSAVNYFDHWWEPTGAIARPFLTVHTTRDPIVPRRGQDLFAGKVAAAGRSRHLLQREVETFGHCAFEATDILGAFHSLVQWVHTGQKPAG